MRILTIALLTVSLAACGVSTGYQYQTGPQPVPAISSITLNSAFKIRPDRASEYIQYGEIRPYNQIVEYYPHCIFELRTAQETARTIQPETFAVTGIQRDRFMAGFRRIMVAGGGNGGNGNPVMSTTTLSLHSDRQPEVFRLTCQQLDEPYLARYVSVEKMRETLGGLFTLE